MNNATKASIPSGIWDLTTQTPHGGQEWRSIAKFVEDFSVTTNPMGTPKAALESTKAAMSTICHYPPSDMEPAKTELARYLAKGENSGSEDQQISEKTKEISKRLILGNGASEVIDLCVRCIHGSKFRLGPFNTQYKEYERAATSNEYETVSHDDDSADLMCIVNPCNPTGEFFTIEEMKVYINDRAKCNSSVIVDESMLPFFGPSWRTQSLTNQSQWILKLLGMNVTIFVINSWTKIWSCPGLRIGSLLCPTEEIAKRILKKQVPWSLNTLAIKFTSKVVLDQKYMTDSWECIAMWRDEMTRKIKSVQPHWELYGVSWMPFIWIKVGSVEEAAFYVQKCRESGTPIRWGKDGYDRPNFIRIAVRNPEKANVVLQALEEKYGA